jgi:hypothetical protein
MALRIKDEKELHQMGFMLDPRSEHNACPIDRLEKAAQEEHKKLDSLETEVVCTYWRLGDLLRALRKTRQHGGWQGYVRGLGIDYNRASRALRVRRRFAKVEDCSGLKLLEALDYQPREKEEPAPTTQTDSPRNPQLRLANEVKEEDCEEEDEEEIEEEKIEFDEAFDSDEEEDTEADEPDEPDEKPEEVEADEWRAAKRLVLIVGVDGAKEVYGLAVELLRCCETDERVSEVLDLAANRFQVS